MSDFHATWRLGNFVFHLARADIFQVPVEAIVNSEQTDFILAGNPSTISGQIYRRWGEQVQGDLNKQTGGETLPVGTVLETTSEHYAAIFHAGFHLPGNFLHGADEDSETEHLKVIRSCIRQVLERALGRRLRSVAFPLIGCGLFGLSPELLAFEFFDEFSRVATSLRPEVDVDVWLVIYDPRLLSGVLQAGVQAWVERVPMLPVWEPLALGVPHLDAFEEQVIRSSHPQWAAWMFVRFAELVTGYLTSLLAMRKRPPDLPTQVVKEREPVTFGLLRLTGARMAKLVLAGGAADAWAGLAARLFAEDQKARRLECINQDRNNLAHGRGFRAAEDIRADLEAFLRLQDWHALRRQQELPGPELLDPWLCAAPRSPGQPHETAVFERWVGDRWGYLVPTTGARFELVASR
ncbi:MAG TPA: macro domain-containing protein [Gemmataceae bacterium]|nr:macro domain-containing protein [Gemmataceae bacterium]